MHCWRKSGRVLDNPLGSAEKTAIAALNPLAVFLPVQPSHSHITVKDLQGKARLKVWTAPLNATLARSTSLHPGFVPSLQRGRESAHMPIVPWGDQGQITPSSSPASTSHCAWERAALWAGWAAGVGAQQGMTLLAYVLYLCCKTKQSLNVQ